MKPVKKIMGLLFAVLTIGTLMWGRNRFDYDDPMLYVWQFVTIAEAFVCFLCFVPCKNRELAKNKKGKLSKRTLFSILFVAVAIPATVFCGIYLLGDRKYYFISLLIIFETIIPFLVNFEGKKPNAREIVIISILCAIGVAGRGLFSMIPQFKPVLAIVIISGVCFGGETGFLVGAVTAFVSNFFFGQGNWTPWQMFCFGIVGFAAGIIFNKGVLKLNKISLCVYGFLSSVILYGGIINFGNTLMYMPYPNKEAIINSYIMGFPLDFLLGISTVFFLWFMAEPMIEKLERIKQKYGLLK